MNIVLNIAIVIVFSFIMYKCIENFDFKISLAVCEGFFIVIYLIAIIFFSPGIKFLEYLMASIVASIILTLLSQKIYEKTNSYIGFLIIFTAIRLLMLLVW